MIKILNKYIFSIVILLCIILFNLTNQLYSQDFSMKTAVLGFYNEDTNMEYDYLSNSIQNSITLAVDNNINDISTVDVSIVKEQSKKTGLNFTTIENISRTLRFYLETDANIIISGKFNIDNENDLLLTHVYIYSVIQNKIISILELENSLNDIFNAVDMIALKTVESISEQREDIGNMMKEIIENSKKPNIVKQPEIINTTEFGVMISWETNIVCSSSAHVSNTPSFDITSDKPAYFDISKNAINHKTYIEYQDIKNMDTIYYKTKDIDIIENEINSEEKSITLNEVIEKANITYPEFIKDKNEELNKYINIKDFINAYELYKNLMSGIKNYGEIIDIAKERDEYTVLDENLKKAMTADLYIKKGVREVKRNYDFDEAVKQHEKAIDYIKENPVEEYLTVEYIESEIERIKKAEEVYKIIMTAAKEYDNKEYAVAKERYELVIKMCEENKLDDLIELEDIRDILRTMTNISPYKMLIKAGFGGGYGSFSILYDGAVPSWDISIGYRASKLVTLGVGMNILYIEPFMNLSLINTLSRIRQSDEIYLKVSAIIGFSPSFNIGGGALIGYAHYFSAFGLYIDGGVYFAYAPKYPEWFLMLPVRIGFVINI